MFIFSPKINNEPAGNTAKDLCSQILDKVVAKLPNQDNSGYIQVYNDIDSPLYQRYLKGEITHEEMNVKMLSTFLENPLDLQGMIDVVANDQVIIRVLNGKIIYDELGIVADFAFDKLDAIFREEAVKELLEYVDKILQQWGERIPTGQLQFEGKEYIYTQTQAEISVTRKRDNLAVLNSNGFTKEASEHDMAKLFSIKNVAQELRQDTPFVPPIRFKM